MNVTLQPNAQLEWINFSQPLLAITKNYNINNIPERLDGLSNRVLPMISEAARRFYIKPNVDNSQLEIKWTRKLKKNKRNVTAGHHRRYPCGLEPVRFGCRRHETRRGGMPESEIYMNTDMLEKFKYDGGDINARNKDGLTPLMQAAATSSNAEVVRSLLSQGAMVDLQDNEGNTALMWVVKNLYLLASPELIKKHLDILDILKKYKANADLAGTANFTPLMITVLGNDVSTFFKIISKNLNLDLQNNAGETALHLALKHCPIGGIIDYLCYNTPNVLMKDKNGNTPFMLSSFRENYPLMEIFISKGANINVIDKREWSVLMHAVNCNQSETVKYLLEKNIDYKFSNSCSENANSIADEKNLKDISSLLFEKLIKEILANSKNLSQFLKKTSLRIQSINQ